MKYRFLEDLAADDPRNYAHRDFKAGDEVYEFHGATYGCINWEQGVACCDVEGQNPFFELPYALLEAIS